MCFLLLLYISAKNAVLEGSCLWLIGATAVSDPASLFSLLPSQVRKSFEQLDRDGDGYITAADLVQVSAVD